MLLHLHNWTVGVQCEPWMGSRMYSWSIDQLQFSFMVYNIDSVKFIRLLPRHILLLCTSDHICLFVCYDFSTYVEFWQLSNVPGLLSIGACIESYHLFCCMLQTDLSAELSQYQCCFHSCAHCMTLYIKSSLLSVILRNLLQMWTIHIVQCIESSSLQIWTW